MGSMTILPASRLPSAQMGGAAGWSRWRWPPHPPFAARGGVRQIAELGKEGGGWEQKEVRWGATHRLIHSPTASQAALPPLGAPGIGEHGGTGWGGVQGSRTELRECPQMVQLYPNPWCSHLQTNRLGAEEAGFLVGVHDGASWHSVCGVHQGWPLGHQGGPVAGTRSVG